MKLKESLLFSICLNLSTALKGANSSKGSIQGNCRASAVWRLFPGVGRWYGAV